jgi:hypothetical protein
MVSLARGDPNRWRLGAAGLALAALLVGVAIVLGGGASRVVNPIGALLWVGSGLLLAASLPAAQRPPFGLLAAAGSGLLLGAVVRPGSPLEALLGFAIAGAVIVLAAGDRVGAWALLAPAIYLPVHLIIGVGRAIVREGGVRTDPPPTASIVPLMMILAAAAAGWLTAAMIRRR